MAGIRGAKNPYPPKAKAGPSGVFKQTSGHSPSVNTAALGAAMKAERKGPPSGRNSGTSPGASHMTNAGLKRGTSNRG